jgi:hypothetical protein
MNFGRVGVALGLLLAVGFPASAQQIRTKMGVTIPFNFVAGGEYLPAGHYTIRPIYVGTDTAWRITSDNDRLSASIITHDAWSPVMSHRRSVVFEQLDNRYILTGFWTTEHSGRELSKPRHQPLEVSSAKNVEVAAE